MTNQTLEQQFYREAAIEQATEELENLKRNYERNAKEMQDFIDRLSRLDNDRDCVRTISSAIHHVSVNSTTNLRLDILANAMMKLNEWRLNEDES